MCSNPSCRGRVRGAQAGELPQSRTGATGPYYPGEGSPGGWKLARAWSLPISPLSLFGFSVAMWHDSGGPGTLVLTSNVREEEHIENSLACNDNTPARTVTEEATIFSRQGHSSREMLIGGLEGQTGAGILEMGGGARERGWTLHQGTPSREAGGRQAVTAVRNWDRASAGLGSLLCKCEEI